MTLAEFQKRVDLWINEHGVRYFNELTNLALLMEEVGEFARLLARHKGEQSYRPGSQPVDVQAALADEMADVLFVLTCLANQLDIDLQQALIKNLEKKTQRDSERHKANPKLYDGP